MVILIVVIYCKINILTEILIPYIAGLSSPRGCIITYISLIMSMPKYESDLEDSIILSCPESVTGRILKFLREILKFG